MRGRAGPCRSVPPPPNSLKSLMRAGTRGGCVAVGLGVCNSLKTLSVPVRAGRVCVTPHTPHTPHSPIGRELGLAPRGSRRRNRRTRRREAALKWAAAHSEAMELKIALGNTREPHFSVNCRLRSVMADERLVAAYLSIVLSGARFEDERLALLRALMTHDERERAKQAIAVELLRREPVPARAN
jgi:hypothetical protein